MPAFKGLKDAFAHKAVRIQMILGTAACVLAYALGCTKEEWIMVLLCIGLVLVAEIFNTCIEKLCDLYSEERCEKIRIIKDMSAAAVLVACITALLVAVQIGIAHV